jgi:hypothetical protein
VEWDEEGYTWIVSHCQGCQLQLLAWFAERDEVNVVHRTWPRGENRRNHLLLKLIIGLRLLLCLVLVTVNQKTREAGGR